MGSVLRIILLPDESVAPSLCSTTWTVCRPSAAPLTTRRCWALTDGAIPLRPCVRVVRPRACASPSRSAVPSRPVLPPSPPPPAGDVLVSRAQGQAPQSSDSRSPDLGRSRPWSSAQSYSEAQWRTPQNVHFSSWISWASVRCAATAARVASLAPEDRAAVCDTHQRSCSHLVILSTSREGLAVPGEQIVAVPSLPLPAKGATGAIAGGSRSERAQGLPRRRGPPREHGETLSHRRPSGSTSGCDARRRPYAEGWGASSKRSTTEECHFPHQRQSPS